MTSTLRPCHPHLAARLVNLDTVDADDRRTAGASCGPGVGRQSIDALARPPQQRARPRDQLTDAKWFGQVVVCAAFEADDFVGLLFSRRQHQDRHVMIDAAVPHGTAQRQTVEAGDHDVEDEQVEAVLFGARQGALPVADGLTGVALMPEMKTDELADVGLVFND